MKKYAIHLLLSTVAILILANASYSQTSPTSTDRATLITLCEKAKDEVIASRALISSYEDTLKKTEKGKALSEAEATELRQALAKEKDALKQKEVAEAALRKALASEVKKKNFYKRVAESSVFTTVVLAAILIL
jgi:hypothetical protein